MRRDFFSQYHPIVGFVYFTTVLAFAMSLLHPLCLVISACGAFSYLCAVESIRALRRLTWMLPLLIVTALVNTLFNHEGITALAYFPNGNPLTAESLAYGMAAAVMVVAVVTWFANVNRVLTSEKIIFLFGRIAPALSLLISMTLRFVPRFCAQFRTTWEIQRSLGTNGKLKTAATVFSGMITWSMEHAIDTADSMKSRGYGLVGRTSYAIWRIEERDVLALLWIAFCGILLLSGVLGGHLAFRYFPTVKGTLGLWFQLIYFALCMTPCAVQLHGRRRR